MTSYADSGVNIHQGDRASRMAYAHAASTFASRKGRIGAPVFEEDGFAGFLDMGDYYLVQSDDSTGTKIDLAFAMERYDTLGYDLAAMVADDAVCTGAEPISISNTLDVPRIESHVVDGLLKGLARACTEQRIVIPAGEIAEVPGAVQHAVWSATVVGIVAKDRVLKPQTIEAGDAVIALRSAVLRSNGFSLARKILTDLYGEAWYREEWKKGTSWGEVLLTPSIIFGDAILRLIGRFGEERAINVKGIAHITGGGIPGKLRRILKPTGTGADLTDLWPPHPAVTDLVSLGKVPTEEAYRTWNMGNGMLVVLPQKEAQRAVELLKKAGREARIAGTITADPMIRITAGNGETLSVNPERT
ncbi:phosphoribosylformylglycinamidine cyclo-ligase [Candidatus Peregrinibacteria bacterium CG10_big_fil_rev_8_21_14_0_10_55_24]|nr:MAG: phosphoribosylformylglycinamidine cyclo-ligase [Candidatus Peregrinibacteria bacterium CG10_big_fil_rev_8_21_14_0_10_55_24]